MRLTTGPLSYSEAISGHDPNQIFAVANKDRAELVRYDLNTREFATMFPGESASDLTYSANGAWAAYSSYPEHSLWRSRSDGTQPHATDLPTYGSLGATYLSRRDKGGVRLL